MIYVDAKEGERRKIFTQSICIIIHLRTDCVVSWLSDWHTMIDDWLVKTDSKKIIAYTVLIKIFTNKNFV